VPGHIHARSSEQFDFEINLIERSGESVILNQRPLVTLAVRQTISLCDWGIPTVMPQAVAYFKLLMPPFRNASRPPMRPKDESDLLALLPLLNSAERGWLTAAVELVSPAHPWLARLAGPVPGY